MRYDFNELSEAFEPIALKVAAAVKAHKRILLVGPPGCGKTMVARRVISLLGPLAEAQRATLGEIYRLAGFDAFGGDLAERRERPFRAPHHTVSALGMMGLPERQVTRTVIAECFDPKHGDKPCQHWREFTCEACRECSPITQRSVTKQNRWIEVTFPARPGEVALAHHGVLLLDELTEFSTSAIEEIAALLDSDMIDSSTVLIGASNPCPCGFRGSSIRECSCGPASLVSYAIRLKKFADKLEMFERIEIPYLDIGGYTGKAQCMSSADLMARVA